MFELVIKEKLHLRQDLTECGSQIPGVDGLFNVLAYHIRPDFAKLPDVFFSFCLDVFDRKTIFQPIKKRVISSSQGIGKPAILIPSLKGGRC
jgi:hypothetical protein